METNDKPPTEADRLGEAPEGPYGDTGVDLSMIRWALSLEPIERLRHVERMNASIAKLRALNPPEVEAAE